ncbi:MAG TPA: hypothetical protein VH351_13025 [Bryobacteraceae bacterium]|jgi:hypothetical protein|nr:hypothetical protein [Bryobacteraceae bacterium]
MMGPLKWLMLERRRRRLRIHVLRQQEHLALLHPMGPSRKVKLQEERELLKRMVSQVAKTVSTAGCDEMAQTLDTSRARCDQMMQQEAEIRSRLSAADAKAERYRELAAAFPAKSFSEDARRRRKTITAAIKGFWRARNHQMEQQLLAKIEAQAAALEQMVKEARTVQNAIPGLAQKFARLPQDEIALNIGTEELFDEIQATFMQVQADAERGNYHKAHQRLAALDGLMERLLAGLERRRAQAREQVDLWLNCATVAGRFPEIPAFPARMHPSDIEKWYALRPLIERLVLERASEQRARNAPNRHSSGDRLHEDHPLRVPLEAAGEDAKLEAFLHAAKIYG